MVGYFIAVGLVFAVAAMLLFTVRGRWYGWLVWLLTLGGMIAVRLSIWDFIPKVLIWFDAILLLFITVNYLRHEPKASTVGQIVAGTVRVMCNTVLKGDKLLLMGKKLCEAKKYKPPKGFSCEEFEIDGLPAEIVKADDCVIDDKIVLNLHGGAYVMPMSDNYRRTAVTNSKLCCGIRVMNIDYRVAPEYKYPCALEDAEKAWNYLLNKGYKPENIIVSGDSAGGNLALVLALKLRDEGKALPKALVLMSPWADMTTSGESYPKNIKIDSFFGNRKGVVPDISSAGLLAAYAGEHSDDLENPYISPIFADFTGFPPMLLQAGSHEILLSDSETIAKNAKEQGVDAKLHVFPGMFHVFQTYPMIPERIPAWKGIASFINKQLFGE